MKKLGVSCSGGRVPAPFRRNIFSIPLSCDKAMKKVQTNCEVFLNKRAVQTQTRQSQVPGQVEGALRASIWDE